MAEISELIKRATAPEVEETVLGALLIDESAYMKVAGILSVDSFYEPKHKALWRTIQTLSSEGTPIDIVTVHQKLIKDKLVEIVGGAYEITELTNRVGSSQNIVYHATILKEKEISRRQLGLCVEIMNGFNSQNYDVFDMNEKIADLSYQCSNTSDLKRERALSEITVAIYNRMKKAADKDVTGIACGLSDIDRNTGGWQDTDLIVMAARPAMGKTACALTMAKFIAAAGGDVAFFSLEMRDEQLISRIISQESGISSNKIRKGKLSEGDWKEFDNAVTQIERMKMRVIDDHYKLHEIVAKATELKMRGELDIIFIDYLQLIELSDQSRSREQDVSKISRTLKELAKKLEVPIIALSQLSRAVEQRADKRPLLSDLRESGAIEQDADMVTFLYRPEYYKQTEFNGLPTQGLAVFEIAKHRNGSLADILLKFVPHLTVFRDYTVQSQFTPPAEPPVDWSEPTHNDEPDF